MTTLGDAHELEATQINYLDGEIPQALKMLYAYHSDIREVTEEEVEMLASRQHLYKQHIPPTPHNLSALRHLPKAVLLRDPEDIVQAYGRAQARKLQDTFHEFAGYRGREAWITRAKELGLLDDLRWFYREWEKEAERHPETTRVVYFEDLVQRPRHVVNEVEEMLGLPLSQDVELAKERYSGRSPVYYMLRSLRISLFRIKQRIPLVRRLSFSEWRSERRRRQVRGLAAARRGVPRHRQPEAEPRSHSTKANTRPPFTRLP